MQALQITNQLEGGEKDIIIQKKHKKKSDMKTKGEVSDTVRLQQLTIAEKLCTNIWMDF